MPQPKKYISNAARQQAYRDRLVAKRPALVPPTTSDPQAWETYLRKIGFGMAQGSFVKDAPQGKGRLITGVPRANIRN